MQQLIGKAFHSSTKVWATSRHLYLAGNCALDANSRETPSIYATESWSGWVGESGKGEQIRAACGIQMDEGGKKAVCDTSLPCVPFACPLSPPLATPLIAIPILRLLSLSFVRHPVPRLPSHVCHPLCLHNGRNAHRAECILSN